MTLKVTEKYDNGVKLENFIVYTKLVSIHKIHVAIKLLLDIMQKLEFMPFRLKLTNNLISF